MFIFSNPLLLIAIVLSIGACGLFLFSGIRRLIPRGMKQKLLDGKMLVRICGVPINDAEHPRSVDAMGRIFIASAAVFIFLVFQSRLWETYSLLSDKGRFLVWLSAGVLLATTTLKGILSAFAKAHPKSSHLDRWDRLYPIAFIVQMLIAISIFFYGLASV